jgi:hypothetical protein
MLKAENYETRRGTIGGWPVNITSYRIGEMHCCMIDNVDPGARFARAEAASREEAEREAIAKAEKYLAQTRRFSS